MRQSLALVASLIALNAAQSHATEFNFDEAPGSPSQIINPVGATALLEDEKDFIFISPDAAPQNVSIAAETQEQDPLMTSPSAPQPVDASDPSASGQAAPSLVVAQPQLSYEELIEQNNALLQVVEKLILKDTPEESSSLSNHAKVKTEDVARDTLHKLGDHIEIEGKILEIKAKKELLHFSEKLDKKAKHADKKLKKAKKKLKSHKEKYLKKEKKKHKKKGK